MAIEANKNVLGLEVAVNNVESVQVLKSQHHFSGIKPNLVYVKALDQLQMTKHISTIDVIKNEVKLGFSLKRILHANEIWMVNFPENSIFSLGAIHLFSLDNHVFRKNFHSIKLAVTLFLNQHDLAKGAPANHFLHVKVVHAHSAARSEAGLPEKLFNFMVFVNYCKRRGLLSLLKLAKLCHPLLLLLSTLCLHEVGPYPHARKLEGVLPDRIRRNYVVGEREPALRFLLTDMV